MPRFNADDVRRYYDRQTQGFVALGQGGRGGAIHRAVWGPGVETREQAFHFVESRLVDALRAASLSERRGISPGDRGTLLHIVDLGCGVGGSLCYLAARLPIRATGITLSPVQARLAADRVRERGLSDRIAIVEGDYTHLPANMETADLAFAIESFVHGPAPDRFFAECHRLLRPGGVLVLCDDFRRATTSPAARGVIDRFCQGWHINTLVEPDELIRLARAAGLEHDGTVDLTPWLELGRPRDRVLAAVVALCGWLPLERTPLGHVVGGTALQTCLRHGWIGYDLVRFRRS